MKKRIVEGYVYSEDGEPKLVQGEFLMETDDPDEYTQDVVIRTADGTILYIDAQDVTYMDCPCEDCAAHG